MMILATLLVPVGDTLSKYLTTTLDPFEIAFFRFVFQVGFLGLAMVVFRQTFRAGNLGLLALGGLCSAGTLIGLIGAFTVMPIATAIAIFFVEPLILTLLSVLFLGEKVGWRRYAAIAVGMCGALIVIRPNWATFGWPAIFPLGAAVAFAGNMAIVRKISRDMTGLAVQFYISVFAMLLVGAGLAVASLTGVFAWSGTDIITGTIPMFVLMGMLSALTFFLFTEAFKRSPASTLAPLQYLEIIGATAMGYLVFGDFPDWLTWVGTAVILASGLYVFRREQLDRKANAVTTRGI